MRVLVAVDGSNSSEAVIREVARRPWPAGSEIAVMTVVDPYFFTKAPLLLEEAKQSAQKSVDELAKPLVEAGLQVSPIVSLGNPRHALPRYASEWKADLVVMGSHGRGAVGRLLVGSTTQAVLRHAMCSLEIVRSKGPGSTEGMRVLVPTDGSEHAQAALAAVAARPWSQGSEFRVMASPEYPVLVGEYPYYAPEQVADLTKQSLEHANAAVEQGAAMLAKAGLKVSSDVIEPQDTPSHSILEAAKEWNADLVVVGSHGRRGFDRLILGSVSETIALHALCSVEVVRAPLRFAEEGPKAVPQGLKPS
jgi:nucleotide-binding universal stress UspA family protein